MDNMKSYYISKIAKQIKTTPVIFPSNSNAIKPNNILKLLKLSDIDDCMDIEMCIISAYSHPNIQKDFDIFSKLNNLPKLNINILYQIGKDFTESNSTKYNKTFEHWYNETNLALQYSHLISPNSKITLILAEDDDFDNLSKCIIKANSLNNVLTICMPWSFDESKINEKIDNKLFNTNKFYCASTGNYKDYQTCPYPASSPNVCAVGGTLVDLNKLDEVITTEYIYNGSGCGKSKLFNCNNIQLEFFKIIGKKDDKRCVPDISLFSNSCVSIILNGVESNKLLGGTSLSTALFSAMINLALIKVFNNNNKKWNEMDNLKELIMRCIYYSGSNIKHYDDYIGLGSPIFDLFVETLEYSINKN